MIAFARHWMLAAAATLPLSVSALAARVGPVSMKPFEMGGAQAIIPVTSQIQIVTLKGVLAKIDIAPNVAGARCGNHYVLTLKLDGGAGAKVRVYDVANAPLDKLNVMIGKTVEVQTVRGGAVASIKEIGGAIEFTKLSPSRPC